MNIQYLGFTIWGDDPKANIPLAQSIKDREEEFERELIKAELDHIDMGTRKEALRLKIEYLRKYNQVTDVTDTPAVTRITRKAST